MHASPKVTIKAFRFVALTVLIAGSCLVRHAALAQQAGIKRTDLQRHDLSISGHEAVQSAERLRELGHDPEKCGAVFRKDHAQSKT